jgi:hypothetical protein
MLIATARQDLPTLRLRRDKGEIKNDTATKLELEV